MKHFFIFLLFGAGLSACSTVSNYKVASSTVRIADTLKQDDAMDALIRPYRDSLLKEMSIVLASAEGDFVKGLPEGTLGNLVCDLVINFGQQYLDTTHQEKLPLICMFNNGGLRSPVSKGIVTVGDVFKLMPFDNELVVVKMSQARVLELVNYIVKVGGAPIGGCTIEGGKLWINGKENTQDLWIITSDYLAKGGDKYDFFKEPLRYIETDYLIRDCLINEIKKKKVISPILDQRIKL